MREVVIVEAVRTPIGRRNGKLKDIHPVVLASLVLKEIINRAGIKPESVDDVVFGCVTQAGEQSLNVARNAWLTAGFPFTTPATTVDRQCGSSQQAIHFAANLIQSGVCDITIAGGVESMSRIPMEAETRSPGHTSAGADRAPRHGPPGHLETEAHRAEYESQPPGDGRVRSAQPQARPRGDRKGLLQIADHADRGFGRRQRPPRAGQQGRGDSRERELRSHIRAPACIQPRALHHGRQLEPDL